RIGQRRGVVAELASPVRAGPPGGALEDQAGAETAGELGVRPEVLPQRRLAFRRPQQVERGEVRELNALVEDQRGLDAAVGQEEVAAELRQGLSISRHRSLLWTSPLRREAAAGNAGPARSIFSPHRG